MNMTWNEMWCTPAVSKYEGIYRIATQDILNILSACSAMQAERFVFNTILKPLLPHMDSVVHLSVSCNVYFVSLYWGVSAPRGPKLKWPAGTLKTTQWRRFPVNNCQSYFERRVVEVLDVVCFFSGPAAALSFIYHTWACSACLLCCTVPDWEVMVHSKQIGLPMSQAEKGGGERWNYAQSVLFFLLSRWNLNAYLLHIHVSNLQCHFAPLF